jgi:hypothetical protein
MGICRQPSSGCPQPQHRLRLSLVSRATQTQRLELSSRPSISYFAARFLNLPKFENRATLHSTFQAEAKKAAQSVHDES